MAEHLNNELMFHVLGYISPSLNSNIDELLGECVTEYGFSKDDCLDILQEFENRYGGYDEVIKEFRSKYYNYDAEEFEAPQIEGNPEWAMRMIKAQYEGVGIDRILSIREDFEGDLFIELLLTNGNRPQLIIEKSMIGMDVTEDYEKWGAEEFGAEDDYILLEDFEGDGLIVCSNDKEKVRILLRNNFISLCLNFYEPHELYGMGVDIEILEKEGAEHPTIQDQLLKWFDSQTFAKQIGWGGFRDESKVLKEGGFYTEGEAFIEPLSNYTQWFVGEEFGAEEYLKNGVPLSQDGYKIGSAMSRLTKKELIEEILGSFPYDYLLENGMVEKVDVKNADFSPADEMALRKYIDLPPAGMGDEKGRRYRKWEHKQKGVLPKQKSLDEMRRKVVNELPTGFKMAQLGILALFGGLAYQSMRKKED